MSQQQNIARQKEMSFVQNLGENGSIHSLHFGQIGNDMFLASSNFNGSIDVIKVLPQQQQQQQQNQRMQYNAQKIASTPTQTPCVSVQIDPNARLIYGSCCDGSIQGWSVESNQTMQVGGHENSICSHIRHAPAHNVLISAALDGQIRYWDVRARKQQGVVQGQAPIISMDYNQNLIVAAFNNRNVGVVDIRKPTQWMTVKHSGLDEDNATVCAMHRDEGYVIASIDSRARVEFISQPENSFPFRAHRVDSQNQVTESHTFTAMTCHPQRNSLVTCGTDGTFITWDFYEKARLTTSDRFLTPISAVACSPDGSIMAFASSYNWYKGANGDPATQNPNNARNYVPKIGLYNLQLSNLLAPSKLGQHR